MRSGEPVNNRKLFGSLLGGAAAGAIGGIGATSLRGSMGFGALGNTVGGIIDHGWSGEKVFTGAVGTDAITGIAGGAAGFKFGNLMVGTSGRSGVLNELSLKAAVQRAEAASSNLGLVSDALTAREAQEIVKGITAAGDVSVSIVEETMKSEYQEFLRLSEDSGKEERDPLP